MPPLFCTVQVTEKLWFLETVAPSAGFCPVKAQEKSLPDGPAVGTFGVGLRVASRNRKVGVGLGVGLGVRLGTGVRVGVVVGGIIAAVCVQAAAAV